MSTTEITAASSRSLDLAPNYVAYARILIVDKEERQAQENTGDVI